MSFSVTYSELANMAIPPCGVVNFRALNLLIQGILDHIQIAELKRVLSGEEDFLQSSQVVLVPREGDSEPIINPMKRLSNVFDHVVDRINKIESQMSVMKGIPSTIELLEASKGSKRPAEDVWNLVKLQKRVEANEQIISTFMATLQDLLSDLHKLKSTTETLQKDVDLIKYIFDKVSPERMDLVCEDLKTQNRKIGALQREVVTIQNKIRPIPKPEDIVLWSSLHEAMFMQGSPTVEMEQPNIWQSTTSLPESTSEQYEDAGHISYPIHGDTPLLHSETTGVLKEEESTQAAEFGGPQGLEQPRHVPGSGAGHVPGPDAGPVPGPRAGPVPGPHAEPVPGSDAGHIPGPRAGPVPGPHAGHIPGSDAGPVPGPRAEPIPGSDVGHIPGPRAGPVPGPRAEPVPGSDAGHIPGPRAGPVPGPHAERVPGSDAGHIPGPRAGPVPGPHAGHIPGPRAGPVPGPHAEPVPGSDAGHIPGPRAGPVPGPHAGHVPGSDAGPVPGPHAEPIPGSDAGHIPGPRAGPVPGPRAEPVPGSDAGHVPGPRAEPGMRTPGFMPASWLSSPMAVPGPWSLPHRAWPGAWPMWDTSTFQPGLGPFGPRGQRYRAPFSVVDLGLPWPPPSQQQPSQQQPWQQQPWQQQPSQQQPWQQQPSQQQPSQQQPWQQQPSQQQQFSITRAHLLSALEEKGSEYEAIEDSQVIPQDEIPREDVPQYETPKEETSQDEIPKDKAPRYRSSKDRASRRRASKDGAPQDRSPKDTVQRDKASKDKTPEEQPEISLSALKKLRSVVATATATATAYARAAKSAAQAVKAVAKVVKETPANQLGTAAADMTVSGPLGAFVDFMDAGFSYGSVIPFGEDELEELSEELTPIFYPIPSKLSLPPAMVTAMQAVSPEEKKKAVQYSMSHIAQMPVRHDSLKEEFAQLSTSLHQRLNYIANMGGSGKLGDTVNILEEKIINIQKSRLQEEELERIWGHQIDVMKNHCMVLDRTMEKLQIRMDDFKILKAEIQRLDQSKADKIEIDQELKEKADRSALASKANRADLETVAMDLNELVQSMLLKITNQESDWKKSLKHIRKTMNTKLVSSDLSSLKKDIEEVWKIVRKLLLEGLRFDPDSAAGFKKKLFQRVKCISCERPVEMMTGPQLITIRNTLEQSRIRPASANSYEYLQRQLIREQQQLQFQNFEVHGSQGFQKDSADGPRNEDTSKHKQHELSTLYPYGNPELMDYDTAEVDILGVDGILYKGRMNSQFGTRTGEKDLTAAKASVSYPSFQNLTDRVRPGSGYHSLGSRTSVNSGTSLHSATPLARLPSMPPVPQLPSLIPLSKDAQEAPGSTKHLKSLRLETKAITQTAEHINL